MFSITSIPLSGKNGPFAASRNNIVFSTAKQNNNILERDITKNEENENNAVPQSVDNTYKKKR